MENYEERTSYVTIEELEEIIAELKSMGATSDTPVIVDIPLRELNCEEEDDYYMQIGLGKSMRVSDDHVIASIMQHAVDSDGG